MCIGLPMQVMTTEPGHAWCEGRGEHRRVNTALVGAVQPGEWLLVFLGDARERIDAARADEVNGALDLVLGVMQGHATTLDTSFSLPSHMTTEQIKQLAGQTGHQVPPQGSSLPPEEADSPWGGQAANPLRFQHLETP